MKKKFINGLSVLLALTLLGGCTTNNGKSSNPPTDQGGDPIDDTLNSITLSNKKDDYEVGDTFIKPTVTAHYNNNTTKDVTSQALFSGYNLSVAGNQVVTVSYTESNITKETTYSIVVKQKQTPPTPQTDINIAFSNFYAEGQWMKLTYDNDPFAGGGD